MGKKKDAQQEIEVELQKLSVIFQEKVAPALAELLATMEASLKELTKQKKEDDK